MKIRKTLIIKVFSYSCKTRAVPKLPRQVDIFNCRGYKKMKRVSQKSKIGCLLLTKECISPMVLKLNWTNKEPVYKGFTRSAFCKKVHESAFPS